MNEKNSRSFSFINVVKIIPVHIEVVRGERILGFIQPLVFHVCIVFLAKVDARKQENLCLHQDFIA